VIDMKVRQFSATLLFCCPVAAHAAQTSPERLLLVQNARETNAIATGGTFDAPVAAARSGVEFSTSSEGSTASLRIGREVVGAQKSADSATSTSWELSLSSPLGENGGLREVATLDGLASGVTAEFKFSRGYFLGLSDWADVRSIEQSDIELAMDSCTLENSNEKCQADRESKGDLGFIARYAPDHYENNFAVTNARAFWISGSAAVGYDKFNWIDPANLSGQSGDGAEYRAGAAASYFLPKLSTVASVGLDFESAFEEADEAIVCLPVVSGMAPTCVSGRPEAPVRQDSLISYFEVRKLFELPSNSKLSFDVGIAARVSHKFEDDVTALSVPIYIVPRDGGLTGGIQFGWRSDRDDFAAGIFVGGTFSLIE
jgi:hypothetical protein